MVADRISQLSLWWENSDPVLVALAMALPALVWLTRSLFANVATGLVAIAASKIDIAISNEIRRDAQPAAAAFAVALAMYLSLQLLGLPGVLAIWLEGLTRVVVVFSVFWLIDSFVQCAIAQRNIARGEANVIQKSWLPQFLRLLLVTLMLVVILKTWGIDLGPALTGLGIAGAAVALSAQDLIRNVIAGINIAGERRFREGDWINFGDGTDGIVEKLQLRSTVIRKFDQSVIHVPNADLANQPLTNFSTRDRRRLQWKVGVPFETGTAKLEAVSARLTKFLTDNDQFVSDDASRPFVTIFAIEKSCMTLLVDCFVSENTWSAELAARQALAFEVAKAFEEVGVDFAFPTQTVHAQLNTDTFG